MNRAMACNKRELKGGIRRSRKDARKCRRPPSFVGENEKPCDVVEKKILTLAEVGFEVCFETSFRPKGEGVIPPVFKRIKNLEIDDGAIHNCQNLQTNKTTWLPLALPVVIVDRSQ